MFRPFFFIVALSFHAVGAESGQLYETVTSVPGRTASELQKDRARLNHTPLYRTSIGYSFDIDMPIGFNVQRWSGAYGFRLELGAELESNDHVLGTKLMLMRSIHDYSFLELVENRIYAFTGIGIWRWDQKNSQGRWFEKPDLSGDVFLGVGVEVPVQLLGGIRAALEAGVVGSRYFSRFEHSSNHDPFDDGYDSKSDYHFGPHVAFHLNFPIL